MQRLRPELVRTLASSLEHASPPRRWRKAGLSEPPRPGRTGSARGAAVVGCPRRLQLIASRAPWRGRAYRGLGRGRTGSPWTSAGPARLPRMSLGKMSGPRLNGEAGSGGSAAGRRRAAEECQGEVLGPQAKRRGRFRGSRRWEEALVAGAASVSAGGAPSSCSGPEAETRPPARVPETRRAPQQRPRQQARHAASAKPAASLSGRFCPSRALQVARIIVEHADTPR